MTTVLTREGPIDMVAIRAAVRGDGVGLTEAEEDVAIYLMLKAGWSKASVEETLCCAERAVTRVAKAPPPTDRSGNPITLNS